MTFTPEDIEFFNRDRGQFARDLKAWKNAIRCEGTRATGSTRTFYADSWEEAQRIANREQFIYWRGQRKH